MIDFQANDAVRPCPRCGTGPESFTPEKIASLAADIHLASSLAAEEAIYKKRIKACQECEALKERVLCAHCGCFVIFRARPTKSYCPHPAGDRWAANEINKKIETGMML